MQSRNDSALPVLTRLAGVLLRQDTLSISLTNDSDTTILLELDIESVFLLAHYLSSASKARGWQAKFCSHGQILPPTRALPAVVKMGGVYLGADHDYVHLGFIAANDVDLDVTLSTLCTRELLYRLEALARKNAWEVDPQRRCFYVSDGSRCRMHSEPFSSLCTLHSREFSALSNGALIREAMVSMRQSMYINEDKKLSLTAEGGHYARFANCLNALAARGYSQDDAIEAIGQLSTNEGIWTELNSEIGIDATAKEPSWKKFEKLSLGIHLLKRDGAHITRDERVVGKRTGRPRQVDISIRFRNGYYEYFAAVECKDTLVGLEQIEAFVVKLEDIGAQKGIVISSTGFQAGAVEAAKAYGIDLFHLGEESGDWTRSLRERVFEVPFPTAITFDADRPTVELPVSGGYVRFEEIELVYPSGDVTTLRRIIVTLAKRLEDDSISLPCKLHIRFPPGMKMKHPAGEIFVTLRAAELSFARLRWDASKQIDLPPSTAAYILSDVIGQKEERIDAALVASAMSESKDGAEPDS
ncbi:MAG TPA: restriction endonuclease [Thermoanaerobaculia bacterium]|jgi:hypothetical protein|nr:restriction endonuclease [Thermoanaerobaculia bacterium]